MFSQISRSSKLSALCLTILVALFTTTQVQADWRAKWARTLKAAKEEGRIVIHAGPGQERFFGEFEKKYPEIKAVYIPGHGGQRVQRVMTERRAGQYLADLVLGGGSTMTRVFHRARVLDSIKNALILPEVIDKSKWWEGRHIYLDKEGAHILAFNGITQTYFLYNPKLIDPNQFKSYWDFLNPNLKGKILIAEPFIPGTDGVLRFLYHNPEIGPEFLRKFLGEMDVTATRKKNQYVDWLARGKFAISAIWSTDRSDMYEAKEQGLSVDWFKARSFKEGAPLSTSSGNIALFTKAAHPNAARVLINWLLSREAQMAYQRITGRDSLRIDIPKNDVKPDLRRLKGVKYSVLVDRKYMNDKPVRKLVNEVWKKRR